MVVGRGGTDLQLERRCDLTVKEPERLRVPAEDHGWIGDELTVDGLQR